MTPKKLDRWERMIRKIVIDGESYDPFIYYVDVMKLLRKEHAWAVRMVKARLAIWEGRDARGFDTNQYGRDCRAAQCREILDRLKGRVK